MKKHGLAEIIEEDEGDLNQSEAASAVQGQNSKVRKADVLIGNKLLKNKLVNDNKWNFNDNAEEEKELESAINIGSETEALTLTKMHTKITETKMSIGGNL